MFQRLSIIPALLALSACVTTGVVKLDPARAEQLKDRPKLALASTLFTGLEAPSTALAFGILGGALVAALQPVAVEPGPDLNSICADAFENGLTSAETLSFVGSDALQPAARPASRDGADLDRHAAELAKINGLTASVRAAAVYSVVPGWTKHLLLNVRWTVVAPDGTQSAVIGTSVASDEDVGGLPDKADPRFRPIWAELARRSAVDLAALLAGAKPKYEH